MKAELKEKKIGSKTGYLKFWVPEVNDIKEITISRDNFDEQGNLNKKGKQSVKRHLKQMTEKPEESSIPEEEKKMEFDP